MIAIDMRALGTIADVIGIFSALFALLAWFNTRRIRKDSQREQDRLDQKVKLSLETADGKQLISLPGTLRRAEVTRAEVLGWIGMLPMKKKGQRFEIGYLNTAEFLDQLGQVQTGRGDVTLRICCTQEELDQFDRNPVQVEEDHASINS
jgi:hypothetical protein